MKWRRAVSLLLVGPYLAVVVSTAAQRKTGADAVATLMVSALTLAVICLGLSLVRKKQRGPSSLGAALLLTVVAVLGIGAWHTAGASRLLSFIAALLLLGAAGSAWLLITNQKTSIASRFAHGTSPFATKRENCS